MMTPCTGCIALRNGTALVSVYVDMREIFVSVQPNEEGE